MCMFMMLNDNIILYNKTQLTVSITVKFKLWKLLVFRPTYIFSHQRGRNFHLKSYWLGTLYLCGAYTKKKKGKEKKQNNYYN